MAEPRGLPQPLAIGAHHTRQECLTDLERTKREGVHNPRMKGSTYECRSKTFDE